MGRVVSAGAAAIAVIAVAATVAGLASLSFVLVFAGIMATGDAPHPTITFATFVGLPWVIVLGDAAAVASLLVRGRRIIACVVSLVPLVPVWMVVSHLGHHAAPGTGLR